MFFLKISLEFRTLEFILSTVGANEICKKKLYQIERTIDGYGFGKGKRRKSRIR